MMARKTVSYNFNLDATVSAIDPPHVFDLQGIDEITIESSAYSANTWVASTITFQVTNDPSAGNWKAPPSGPVTVTAAAITDPINVTPYRWGRLYVSTPAATAFKVQLGVYGEGEG